LRVDSTEKAKHNERNDQLFVERSVDGRARTTTDEKQVLRGH